MRNSHLEQQILDYIENWYKAKYNGILEVDIDPDTGIYKFSIAVPSYMTLTSIGGDFTDDADFLTFIFKELRERNYMRVQYYRTRRTPDSKDE